MNRGLKTIFDVIEMPYKRYGILLLACLVYASSSVYVYAQDNPVPAASVQQTVQVDAGEQTPPPQKPKVKKKAEIDPNKIPSLFFTYWEHVALMDAKRSRGSTSVRAPTQAELALPSDDPRPKPPPEKREVRLGGIVYVSGKNWTIWLNGKRVTPDALPREAISLNVFEEHIEIKWHDDWTNQIYPIRLKPHSRFNLDTRIFLPG